MLRNKHVALKSRQSGNIVVLYMVFLLPLVLTLGGFGIDIARYYEARSQLGRAMESAIIGVSQQGTCSRQVAEEYIQAYFGRQLNDNLTLTKVQLSCSGQTELHAELAFNGFFWRDAAVKQNWQSLKLERASVLPLEIVLVVDISGSMALAVDDLKTAMNGFISNMPKGAGGSLSNARIAIVPFSHEVVMQQVQNGQLINSFDCFRVGFFAPAPLVRSDWEQMMERLRNDWPDDDSSVCSGNTQPPSLFLTDNTTTLNNRIAQLDSTGATEIELGVVWGWRALDPRWQTYKDGQAGSLRYGASRKVMVLFTDATGISASHLTRDGSDSLCGSMKRRDIEIFTVKLGNDLGNQVLEDCATSAAHFQASPNADELDKLFENIYVRIGTGIKLSL